MRIEVQAKIDAIPDADYNLPQNDATVHGEFMFADQTVDAYVYDLSRPRQETYSPTGNSWNQSDIDSEFHNYDPKRYPPRGPPQKNPQDSESVAPTDNASQMQQSQFTGMTGVVTAKDDQNTVTSFGDLVQKRFRQNKRNVQAPSTQNRSIASSTLSPINQRVKLTKSPSKSKGKRNSSGSSGRGRKQKQMAGDDMNGIMTQKEIDQLQKNLKPFDQQPPKSSQRNTKKHVTMPSIDIQNVDPRSMRKLLDSAEHGHRTQDLFAAQTLDEDALKNYETALQYNHMVQLKKNRTIDDSNLSERSSHLIVQSQNTEMRSNDEENFYDQKRTPNISPWHQNNEKQYLSSTIQITGDKKELTQLRKTSQNQESQFSFKKPPTQLKQASPVAQKLPQRDEQGTPERILQEFNEKAKAYKMGIGKSKDVVQSKQMWRELMNETKDEWELTTADMYNPSPQVLYDAYLVNLSNTVAAKLSQIAGRNMRVNLRQGKPFKKIQINVTTVHQTKFRLTKFGNGFGYGTTDKLSPEDAFLASVFEKADPEVADKLRIPGQRDTLAQIVPQIIKKAPRPVKDSLKALHLTCRRGVPIDKNGMPFLVEKDPYNREKYMAYLRSKKINQTSTKSIRSHSLNNKDLMQMRMMLGDQEASSMARLTNHESQKNTNKISGRKQVYHTVQPKPKKDIEVKNKQLIKKVDHLIDKFDESFRQNEIQQKAIRQAQDKLQAAKVKILDTINQNNVSRQECYESQGSYKKDSCIASSDEEEKTNNASPDLKLQSEMGQTFQTNQEREEYYNHLGELSQHFSNVKTMADDARRKQWDTRKELRVMSNSRVSQHSSLANTSKKTFKRNRNHDNIILNERSGDLMSHTASQQQVLLPQELYQHMERQRVIKDAHKAKMPPAGFRSQAEKSLLNLHKSSSPNMKKMSLMELTNSRTRLINTQILQGESQIMKSQNLSPAPTFTVLQQSKPEIKYRPVPMQALTPKKQKITELPTNRSPSFKFDVKEAAKIEARNATMNQSIMSQLTIQQQSPRSNMPRKKQQKNNSDIEAFIPKTPVKKSPKFISTKTSQITVSKSILSHSGSRRKKPQEASQTMIGFNKNPEPLMASSKKLPKVDGKRERDSEQKTMHMTMTELGRPFAPSESHAPVEDSGFSATNAPSQQPNPMQTSLFGSDDMQLRERANQSGPFGVDSNNMQVVDEADEIETIYRPSLFEVMNQRPEGGKFATTAQSPMNNSMAHKFMGSPMKDDHPMVKQTMASRTQLSLKAIKENMLNQAMRPPKKPPVPLQPLSKPVQSTAQVNGYKTARGVKAVVDLRPIDHTSHKKFKPHPNCYSKFRTSLPPKKVPMKILEKEKSPFQMMLEEMKNEAGKDGEGVSRSPMVLEDDTTDFHGGVVNIEGEMTDENMRATYQAMEDKLEQMMQNTNSTFNMGQTMMSEMNMQTRANFAKMVRDEADKKSKDQDHHKHPYFKNQVVSKAPMSDFQTKLLERKFQETDKNFKIHAQRLIDDVRNIERLNIHKGKKDPMIQTMIEKNNKMLTQTLSSKSSIMPSSFQGRNASMNLPHSTRNASIKEQLQALKLSEANSNQNPMAAKKRTNKYNWEGRRKSEFINEQSHRRLNQTGFETSQIDTDFRGDTTPRHIAGQTNTLEIPTIMTPIKSVRHHLGETARGYKQMYGGQSSRDDGSSVNYSFKKFRMDSKKEHTRQILPAVIKLSDLNQ